MEGKEVFRSEEAKKKAYHDDLNAPHKRIYDTKLLISMVGLPARGKTHISRKLTRFLTWLGYNAKVFNIGDKRRKVLGVEDTSKADFFDPNNQEGVKQREMLAEETLTDVVKFLLSKDGNIAIFDGTNSNVKRRKMIRHVINTYLPETDYFFLELVCTDEEQIEMNLRKTKLSSPDFVGWKEEDIIESFRDRIRKYESNYEEVSTENDGEDVPFMKIINVGQKCISQGLRSALSIKIMQFLLNLHLEDRPLYLIRHGESTFIPEGRVGGDPPLTENGKKFAQMLNGFFEEESEKTGYKQFVVNTSTLKRTVETASYLDGESGLFDIKKPIKLLDEINAGLWDGLTYYEIDEHYPEVAAGRKEDKMNYRYPRGEWYYDVIDRIEPYIIEIENKKSPVVIFSHKGTLRCLYGYLISLEIDIIWNIEIPCHTVFKITPQTYGYQEERFRFDIEAGTYKKVGIEEEELDFIKKSRRRLSFDLEEMQSTKSNKLGEKSKFDKKIYSSSDIYSIASIDLNKEEEPANSKLKRAAKFPIKEEEDES